MEKENNPINKLTIVEGHPNRKDLPLFSRNLENLLLKAATDKNFKENLLQDRNSILEDSEFSLSPQDKMILKSISVTRLSDMIEKFTIQQTSRRSFLKNAAATLALLTIGCISKSVNTSSGIDDNTPPPVTPEPLPTNYCSRVYGITPEDTPPIPGEIPVNVGPEGATVNHPYSGLKLIIPKGALEKTVEIKITAITEGYKYNLAPYSIKEFNNKNNFSYMMPHDFSPQDLQFKKDISIFYPLPGLKYSELIGKRFTGNVDWRDFKGNFEEKVSIEKSADGCGIIRNKNFGIYILGYLSQSEKPIFPKMTLIPSGKVKNVEVSNFYAGKTEVTNKEYCKFDINHDNHGNDLPVVNVSWYDAVRYCNWLTMCSPDLTSDDCCYAGVPPNITSNTTKKGYHLPTEAEYIHLLEVKRNKSDLDLQELDERVFKMENNEEGVKIGTREVVTNAGRKCIVSRDSFKIYQAFETEKDVGFWIVKKA